MLSKIVTDRQIAEVIVKYTSATSKDMRRLSNIASITAEILHERETGCASPTPAPTDG